MSRETANRKPEHPRAIFDTPERAGRHVAASYGAAQRGANFPDKVDSIRLTHKAEIASRGRVRRMSRWAFGAGQRRHIAHIPGESAPEDQ